MPRYHSFIILHDIWVKSSVIRMYILDMCTRMYSTVLESLKLRLDSEFCNSLSMSNDIPITDDKV